MPGRVRKMVAKLRDKPRHREQAMERVRYAAAQMGRMTEHWMPAYGTVNELIASASPLVRRRMQQLVRDFPPFARAVNNLVDFTVGTGVRFQSQACLPGGAPDKRLQKRIEDSFEDWAARASVDGRMHFFETQQLVHRQICENGEFLAAFQQPKRPGRHPVAVRLFEPAQLTELHAKTTADREIFQGVEYDPETGEIHGFHLEDESPRRFIRTAVRLDAADALHGVRMYRPGQLRGITEFAPAILLAGTLREAVEAELDGFSMASRWLAFVYSDDPTAAFQGRGGSTGLKSDGTTQRVEEIENAVIEYLQPGEKIQLAEANRPGSNWEAFVRFILRMVAVTASVPYELLSGDYSGLSYTNLRAIRNDFRKVLATRQQADILHYCVPVFTRWLDWEALSGRLPMPGYFADPARFRKACWIPSGMPSVDPLREAKADVEMIKAKLRSPQQVILSRGDDPEEVLDQIASWRELCADRDLEFDAQAVSTAMQNNPAAVMGEAEEEE